MMFCHRNAEMDLYEKLVQWHGGKRELFLTAIMILVNYVNGVVLGSGWVINCERIWHGSPIPST